MIPRSRTDQFSVSFLLVAVRLWNLLPSGMFGSDTLSSFKSAVNLCLQRAKLDSFVFLISVFFSVL